MQQVHEKGREFLVLFVYTSWETQPEISWILLWAPGFLEQSLIHSLVDILLGFDVDCGEVVEIVFVEIVMRGHTVDFVRKEYRAGFALMMFEKNLQIVIWIVFVRLIVIKVDILRLLGFLKVCSQSILYVRSCVEKSAQGVH